VECCPECGGEPKCRQIIYGLESDDTNYSVIGYVCSKCGHLWKPSEGKEVKRIGEELKG